MALPARPPGLSAVYLRIKTRTLRCVCARLREGMVTIVAGQGAWTGEDPEPEAEYNPITVDGLAKQLVDVPVSEMHRVVEVIREHELGPVLERTVGELNYLLSHASYDVDGWRRREVAERVAELQRLTGSDITVTYPEQ